MAVMPASMSRMKTLLLGGVIGPDRGAEAEGNVVGNLDGFIDIFHAEQHGDGAKNFLMHEFAVARHVGENTGGEIGAGTGQFFAAE